MRDAATPSPGGPAPRCARPSVSVVMPAFNEAQSLPQVLTDLLAVLTTLADRWEVLVVDDGSHDATADVMRPWVAAPGVRYLRLSRNFGKEAALTAGIDRALGDVVVLMDADGQHPPALLPQMLALWREGADMISARRASRADESFVKRWGTRLFYWAVNAGSPVHVPIDAGDFRLLDRRVVEALKSLPERNRFMKGLYAWVGFDSRMLDYTPMRRRAGRSNFSIYRLARLAFTGLTAFSNMPLKLWSGVGSVIALGALLYGVWIVIEHFVEGHPIPGWPTLVAGLMFFSGVQLLSIGILGEYIGRIFDEVKQRPLYVIALEAGTTNVDAAPARAPAVAAAVV
jgi:glycosyltransferase involved in cell wall biosynthesis